MVTIYTIYTVRVVLPMFIVIFTAFRLLYAPPFCRTKLMVRNSNLYHLQKARVYNAMIKIIKMRTTGRAIKLALFFVDNYNSILFLTAVERHQIMWFLPFGTILRLCSAKI